MTATCTVYVSNKICLNPTHLNWNKTTKKVWVIQLF